MRGVNESVSSSDIAAPTTPPARPVRAPQRGINLEIEYLRAAAILLVLILHVRTLFPASPNVFRYVFHLAGAWTGVDLFFAISGYVICRSFEPFFDAHRHDGRWWSAARAFWVRRIFRLIPSAWLWLLIAIVVSWGFDRSGWLSPFGDNLKSAIFVLLNVANFAEANGSLVSGNSVYWSLALEDQFYLLFPLFLFVVPRPWRWRLFLLLILVQALPDREMGAHPFLWFSRLDALMWGCLVYSFSRSAMYGRLEPKFCRRRSVALAVNAVLLIAVAIIPVLRIYPTPWPTLRVEALVAPFCGGLVFLASYERGYVLPLPQPLRTALAWIGSRSYALYLIHIPLYGIVQEIWLRYVEFHGAAPFDGRYAYAAMILVLLPILAELNFRLIETPLRRKGKDIAQRIMMKSDKTGAKTVDKTAEGEPLATGAGGYEAARI